MHDAVAFALEGKGLTTIDGRRVEWNAWDAWHTPAWTWHRHTNSDPQRSARLLAVTDAPLIEALGLQHIQDVGDAEPPGELGAAVSQAAPPRLTWSDDPSPLLQRK